MFAIPNFPSYTGVMQLSSTLASANAAIDELCSVHPTLLSSTDASRLLSDVARLANKLDAYKAALASHAIQAGAAQLEGARDNASWVAAKTGASVGVAKSVLQTAAVLQTQPDVASAFASGDLSVAQASLISTAVTSSPASASSLVEFARRGVSLNELKKSCRAVSSVQTSREQEVSHWQRLRSRRFLRTWTDNDGMVNGQFRLMPDDGAVLLSRLSPMVKDAYRAAKKQKGLIAQEHLAADGFVELIETSGKERKTRRVDVVISVDHEALMRGHALGGETSEILGIGPVPIALVEELKTDSHVRVIVNKKGKPLAVFSETQEIPTAMRVAVKQRDRCCQVPGCESTFGLDVDHIRERRHGGRHHIDNLMLLCRSHHQQKTFHRWHMIGEGATRAWVQA
jgi:hypothetical protein